MSRCASLVRSLPLAASSPTFISPTRASPSRSKYRCANTLPRIAKFKRSCGLHMIVAPASSSNTGEHHLRGDGYTRLWVCSERRRGLLVHPDRTSRVPHGEVRGGVRIHFSL